MTEVSISEFRNNIKYYSSRLSEEDILVMSNGKPIMKITSPNKNKQLLAKSLFGSIPKANEEKILEEKIKEL